MTKIEEVNPNPIIHFLTSKRLAYVRHILFFFMMALVFNLLTPDGLRLYAEKVNVSFEAFYIGQSIDMLVSLGLIYFNLYFLFPRYFKKGLYNNYLVGILSSATLFFLVAYVIQRIYVVYFGKLEQFAVQFNISSFIENVTFPIVFLCATTGYKVFKEWINDQERLAEMTKEQLNSELNQLKNQVNPHFLFNTLNNLHVLIQTKPDKAADIVLGLSDVLRYQIYDSQHDKVFLKKDIEIIQQYLELEQIRRDNLTINVQIRNDIQGILVPPLLFTNFVDNAIKHSLSREPSYINIVFYTLEKDVYFEITNSKPPQKLTSESTGLGLPNIKKRLVLLYGINHTLKITDDKNLFTIKLKIPV
jgi:sensor histidine kinase YesM